MSAFIHVDGVTLDVPLFLQRERHGSGWGHILLGAAFDPPKRRLVRLLDDVSFEVRDGDRLAILGRNGAGKSTLLRVLNRVYQPTSGSIRISGTCQALLNMGLGFNGEATVSENIYLRGIAMGLRAKFIDSQIESILEFSGLREKALHRLRTLSSGQRMRLGFAISTSVQHDIMLMDEWVGASDAEFMAKAKERMQGRVNGSKIVVLASHSVGLVRDVCNRGIVLERGRLIFDGGIMDALRCYHESLARPVIKIDAAVDEEAKVASGSTAPYGAIERIVVSSGVVEVSGWCVSSEGIPQSGFALEIEGLRHVPTRVEHLARPDVVRHLGLIHADCGFRAYFDLPMITAVGEIGGSLRMLAGQSSETAYSALRIAPKVAAALRGADL